MANSKILININEVIPIGGVISFVVSNTVISYTFVAARTQAGESTVGSTITETINNYISAVALDYPTIITGSYAGTGNQVQFTAVQVNDFFSQGEAGELNVTFQYVNNQRLLGVSDFLGDNYLINNDIILKIESIVNVPYITLQFNNLTNQEQSGTSRHYLSADNTVTVNISPYIKSLFSYPNAGSDYTTTGQAIPNVNTIRISMNFEGNSNPHTFTKSFIRGGKRSNRYNETLSTGQWLTPSDKIPVWIGFPVAGYYLETISNSRVITKKLDNGISSTLKDLRRQKGCNPLYVKFLNQMGGYSYWLFDSFTETENNANIGSFIRNNELADLGNTSESKIQATGKVPQQYIEIIKDLGVSPEIYIYREGNWKRVLSNSNPVVLDDNKRSYNVKISLSPEYRFNPSLVWSN